MKDVIKRLNREADDEVDDSADDIADSEEFDTKQLVFTGHRQSCTRPVQEGNYDDDDDDVEPWSLPDFS